MRRNDFKARALLLGTLALTVGGCTSSQATDGGMDATDSDSETATETGDLPGTPPQCGDAMPVAGERCWHEVVTYPTVGAPSVMGAFDIDVDTRSEVFHGRSDGVNHVIWPYAADGSVQQSNLSRRILAVCLDKQGLAAGSLYVVEATGPDPAQADLVRLRQDVDEPTQLVVHSRVALPDRSLGCALGDLDGDGSPEVAVGLFPADSLTVVGVEPDAMTVLQTLAVGRHPRDVQVFDLDGDGLDDVVVALENLFGSFGAPDSYTEPGQVAVLRASPSAELTVASTYDVVDFTHGVDVGDLDQDGAPDIAAVGLNARVEGGQAIPAPPGEEVITVRWGDGAGDFGERLDLPGGASARNVKITDFDRDGLLDLMTVAWDSELERGVVQVWFGTTTPKQFERVDIPLDQALYFDVGDFNGDGVPDLVGRGPASEGLDLILSNP